MHITRRQMINKVGVGVGALAGGSLLSQVASAAQAPGPRRVIFFLQNQGFDPATAIPEGMKSNGSLANKKLPLPMQPLQPYIDRMHIINGLHGRHTSPAHSAYFGALGGYRGGSVLPPSAATIDYVLSETLPKTIIPHLCIGMDALSNMVDKSTVATLSARGANQPIFMHSNPIFLYQLLFGSISEGDVKQEHTTRLETMNGLHEVLASQGIGLPKSDALRYGQYVDGFRDMKTLQARLAAVSDHLRKFAPATDDRYTKPEFETDWHDVLLDLGISALTSGLTNTLTIASGRGTVNGSWFGLGVEKQGHTLGHMTQRGNEIWDKIRQYNSRMLVKIMEELEKVAEGNGTMMDNTLIVYTSNNAEKQHTSGQTWPFVLLGNFSGRIKTGQLTTLDGSRPINALYATILQAANGKAVERFNMDGVVARKYDSGSGPLQEILV